MNERIAYCDYNAGAPIRPSALEALRACALEGGNPSSIHAAGRRARGRLEAARGEVAGALGALGENVIFTSGATEALHLAIEGCRDAARSMIVFAGEHDAVHAQAGQAFEGVFSLRSTSNGTVDLAHLEELLADAPAPALVAVQLANNETGAVQPVAQAAALARNHGALMLVDAVQGPGRLEVDIAALDATYLVVSSHKVGGPSGAGALVLAPGAPFRGARLGGGQERGRRPGTENAPAAAGFGAAMAEAGRAWRAERDRQAALRDRFEAGLAQAAPHAVIFSRDAPRLANTSLFALPGWRAEAALISLDLAGVAVSSGSACSSGKVRASRVLEAMGVDPGLAACALRASFGWASTERDIEKLLGALKRGLAQNQLSRGGGSA